LLRQRDYFRPSLQRLARFLTDARFSAQARELGGFHVSGAGEVRPVALGNRSTLPALPRTA